MVVIFCVMAFRGHVDEENAFSNGDWADLP